MAINYVRSTGPEVSLVGLQMSLFGDDPFDMPAEQSEQAWADAMAVVAAAETETAATASATVPLRRRDRSEDPGPALQLDDEDCRFFRNVGCRMLLAEMVVQSIRDMIAVADSDRCEKLKQKDPVAFDEILASASWLNTDDGWLAVQLLFPDWDCKEIIGRIKDDPAGVIKRFDCWASLADARRISDDSGLADSRLVGIEMSDVGGWDMDLDYSYR